ncbi:MAG: hypothetical protein U0353_08390 [Sandaracinus sp.]
MSMLSISMLSAVLWGTTGCEDPEARLAEDLADRRAQAELRRDAITIAAAPEGLEAGPPLERAARLFLGAGTVDLDRSPGATTVEQAELARLAYLNETGELELAGRLDPDGHPTGLVLGEDAQTLRFSRAELVEVAVYADRALPARTLAQTVALLADLADTYDVFLRVGANSHDATLGLRIRALRLRTIDTADGRRLDPPPFPRPSAMGLELIPSRDGAVSLLADAGWIAPGCTTTQAQETIAVPGRDGALDTAGLDACLRAIAQSDTDDPVGFVRVGDLTIEQLAPVLAALGRTAVVPNVVLLAEPLARASRPRPCVPTPTPAETGA